MVTPREFVRKGVLPFLAGVIILAMTVGTILVSLDYGWHYAQKGLKFDVDVPPLMEDYAPIANHTVIFLIDGARYDISEHIAGLGIGVLGKIKSEGAWFTSAETILPSISPAARASALTATVPEIHGYTGYGVESKNLTLDIGFNAFRLAKDLGLSTAVVADPLTYGIFKEWVDKAVNNSWLDDEDTHKALASFLDESGVPGLLYVCYSETDSAGHGYGGASWLYYETVLNASILVEEDVKRIWNETGGDAVFFIFSDHGHIDAGGHGGAEPEVMRILFGILGRGVRRTEVTSPTFIYQLGATIAFVLGTELPAYTMLPPLFEAFNVSDRRMAGYYIHFAELKLKQIEGLTSAFKVGLGRYEEDVSSLSGLIDSAKEKYRSGDYQGAIEDAEEAAEGLVAVFNGLLEGVLGRILLVRGALATVLVLVAILIVAGIARVFAALPDAACGLALFGLTFALYYALFHASGHAFTASSFPTDAILTAGTVAGILSIALVRYVDVRRGLKLRRAIYVPLSLLSSFLAVLWILIYSGLLFGTPLLYNITVFSYFVAGCAVSGFIGYVALTVVEESIKLLRERKK